MVSEEEPASKELTKIVDDQIRYLERAENSAFFQPDSTTQVFLRILAL